MQFFTAAIVATILAFTSAVPTSNPYPSGSFYAPQGAGYITPKAISQFTVSTGAVNFKVQYGKVFKGGRRSGITTLMTFDIPPEAEDKTCAFHFFLDLTSIVSGTGQFDIFLSQAPAT
jgi:hypothetical protein